MSPRLRACGGKSRELPQPEGVHVVEMDVTDLAVALLVHVIAHLADPRRVADARVVGDGLDHHAARAGELGRVIDRKLDLLAGAIGEAEIGRAHV